MKRHKLVAEKRKILGKKIKKLRREGILPANVYGKEIKSQAVQLPYKDFEKVFKETGETGLIDLELDGKTIPVLIHNLQIEPLSRTPLHADFFQVNLKEKVKTMVPLVIVGEPKAVSEKIGLLLQPLAEVEIEALPEELPENIEVNVAPLSAIDEQIIVSDLKKPAGVEILTDPDQVVVKIAELVTKEAQEEAAAEAAAAEEAKEEAAEEAGEPTEGEAKPEGEEVKEKQPAEEKPEDKKEEIKSE